MDKTKLFFLILLTFFATFSVQIECSAETMSVQVKKSTLRDRPSFLGKMIGHVTYGQELEITERKNSWLKVKTEKTDGWLHPSALTNKKIYLQAGAKDVSRTADTGEMALAGKGFNEEVEKEFRKDTELNYEAVDQIESYEISNQDKYSFIRDGGLSGAEVIK